jgi:putative intracellular protease/amidase
LFIEKLEQNPNIEVVKIGEHPCQKNRIFESVKESHKAMKNVLMILASERFREIEYLVPKAFFEQAGHRVYTASSQKTSIGRFGYRVENNFILSEINSSQFDGIYLVGGAGSLEFLDNKLAQKIFEEFLEQQKPIAAICAAPRNFLKWGFLVGKSATGHNGDGQFVIMANEMGAFPEPESITIKEGLILTANGPEAAEQSAIDFIKML